MKSNKGFTLIELLAVIVVLAIIALIATPTILGVIDKARQGAAQSSALGYIDAVEKQIMLDMVDTENTVVLGTTSPKIQLPSGSATVDLLVPVTGVQVKGESPESGTLKIDSTGSVANGSCMVVPASGVKYVVTYDGNKATAEKGDSCTSNS